MGFANFIIGAIILLFGGGLIAFLLGLTTVGLVFVITGVITYLGVILFIIKLMETNDILTFAVLVIASIVIGVALSYFLIGNAYFLKEVPSIEPTPTCSPVSGQYTPGTCGVYSNMTFYQCIPTNFTGEANGT